MSTITYAMRKKYLKSKGDECPFCGSNEIEGCGPMEKAGYITQRVICQECEEKWEVVYTLTEIKEAE
jgi:transcription elongation factor Elf1